MCILLLLYFLADEVDNSQFSVNKVNLHQIQADLTFSQQKRGLQTSKDEIKPQKSTTRSGFNFKAPLPTSYNSMHFCDYISDALHERSLIIRLVNSWLIAASAAPLHTKLSMPTLPTSEV